MLTTAEAFIEINPIAKPPAVLEPIGPLPDEHQNAAAKAESSWNGLAFTLVTVLRQHGHIGNVLTHLSRANWTNVEQALQSIVDPDIGNQALSPLAQDTVELICGDRGVTGRIMKPYFRAVLRRLLGTDGAAYLIHRIDGLFAQLECEGHAVSNTVKTANELSVPTEFN